jgi:hypothetical protein
MRHPHSIIPLWFIKNHITQGICNAVVPTEVHGFVDSINKGNNRVLVTKDVADAMRHLLLGNDPPLAKGMQTLVRQ